MGQAMTSAPSFREQTLVLSGEYLQRNQRLCCTAGLNSPFRQTLARDSLRQNCKTAMISDRRNLESSAAVVSIGAELLR